MIPQCILVIENDDDRAFMEALFWKYNRLMYANILKFVQDPWVTEDLLQITLEKLIDRVGELRTKDRTQLVNYIITACRNRAKNYLRDKGRKPEFSFDEILDHEDVDNGRHAMELRFVREAEMDALAKIWPDLDERSRYLLEGRYILERSPEEMAQDLGIKPASVRMALTRARKNAYRLIEKNMEEKK